MKSMGGKRCYYCGGRATSGEHVPPKQMFKAFQCDSITVPSCDEHNSSKSGRDQAIVSALLIPLDTGRHRHPLMPEIGLAIEAARPSFERAKRSAVRTRFLKDPPQGLEDLPDLAHVAPSVSIVAWIRQLTAGIIYSGIGSASTTIRWSKAIVWSPEWVPTDSPAPISIEDAAQVLKSNQEKKLAMESLTWLRGWSAWPKPYPDIIYSFHFHFFANKQVIVRHRMYSSYTWYVQFKSSNINIAKLRRKLENA